MPTNVLFIMTDQQRFDTIAALGNSRIHTPNMDRLVARGVSFANAYSTCPVCVPARYTVRTGCEPPTTRIFSNERSKPGAGQAATLPERCGPYLAQKMRSLGYRTFGIGKFHTQPWDEDLGFDVHLHSEELYGSVDQRMRDCYAAYIRERCPAYAHVEQLQGERTEMYYMPQTSPFPAEHTVEAWAADRAVEQLALASPGTASLGGAATGGAALADKPFFGFVSFIGPHPPFAPPVPFNRLYDPDRMRNPVRGDKETDHMDEHLPWMNHLIWAEDVNDSHARVLWARYYGELTYIDACLGRILDAVEKRPDADDTLICFFADHGDHMGDHHSWQKESFFEQSCHIPFLVSWPKRLPKNQRSAELVALTDLFGMATYAAGAQELREGVDVLGKLTGIPGSPGASMVPGAAPGSSGASPSSAPPGRDVLFGYYGEPGTPLFKIMVRRGSLKFIFFANGGGEQLFDLDTDPNELTNLAAPTGAALGSAAQSSGFGHNGEYAALLRELRALAVGACRRPGAEDALDGDDFKVFPRRLRPLMRIHQFDASRGIHGFPERPEDGLRR